MKALIVEDDFTSRLLLQKYLAPYGETNIVINGEEAIKAFKTAFQEDSPYDLICLDIMMPEIDGQEVLKQIRETERRKGVYMDDRVNVIMTTALGDSENVVEAFDEQCDAYLVKPIQRQKLVDYLRYLNLIK